MTDIENSIAIIGMGLRFPGANTPAEFWRNLKEGRDCSRLLSREELLEIGVSAERLDDPLYVYRSFDVDNIEKFDPRFFGMSPREARLSDPQLRFLLETTYESIEDSGHNLLGENVGLYLGATDNKYWLYHKLYQSALEGDGEVAKRIFTLKDYFATQVSHKLGLTGPSISMNSACSTALLATHEACNHLLMYDCDYAIAGGCEILQGVGYRYMEGGLSSRDGYVRAFDATGTGTTFGSGVGMVVLRRLSDALEDNDHIYAVIRSTAVNNDGNQKVGYMAPGVVGQMGVIHSAIERAGVSARDISYVEAHGTGTPVGDPIEIESISRVYRKYTEDSQYCAIGSVKTNVGHLSIAAGVAGLIKTALMLKHKQIPASLNFDKPNPAIDFPSSPFYVNCELRDWETEGQSRIAGVSAFGVGGTNTHAILEEATEQEKAPSQEGQHTLLVLSGKCGNGLQQSQEKLADFLCENPTVSLADVSYTLFNGRAHYAYRNHVVAENLDQAVEQLRKPVSASKVSLGDDTAARTVFMFPGQGSQYVDMGKELYEREPEFSDSINECVALLRKLDIDILSVIFPHTSGDESSEKIKQTHYTQLSLFVVSYAMTRLLNSWGVQPQAMIGHSIGEYVAACVSGVFSLEEALTLVHHRGRLMQSMPSGSMLSVPLSSDRVTPMLMGSLSIAGVNGPASTVVSGKEHEIEELLENLTGQGVGAKLLHTSHAFHSSMMEPILAPYLEILKQVSLSKPRVPFISNVTGDWIRDEDAIDPEYWVQQLRAPVMISKGVDTLIDSGFQLFTEVGPGASLCALLGQHDVPDSGVIARTMRRPKEQGDDRSFALEALGALWAGGSSIEWNKIANSDQGSRISLPTYPFQHADYWLEQEDFEKAVSVAVPTEPMEHPLLGRRVVSTGKVMVFENIIDEHNPRYLVDHRLVETTIFPGAGFTQMALEVGRFFVKNKRIKLDHIRFAQALMLPKGVRKVVQVIASATELDGCQFEIVSRTEGKKAGSAGGDWVVHAKGFLSPHSILPSDYPMPELMQQTGSELVPLDLYYDALKFITFGSSFRAVRRMWIGEDESMGYVKIPEHLLVDLDQYSFHPVLLDASFQVIDGPKISESGTLPVGLRNLVIYDDIPSEFYVYARRSESESEEYSIGQIEIFSETGKIIARIEHYLQKEIADSLELRDQWSDYLYAIDWSVFDNDEKTVVARDDSSWLLVGGGEALESRLDERTEKVLAISHRLIGEEEKFNDSGYSSQELFDSDKAKSNEFFKASREGNIKGVLFARGLDEAAEAGSLSLELLALVQQLVELDLNDPPALTLITRGSQYCGVQDPQNVDGVQQAAVWGFGNTITVEHPEFNCVRCDLSADDSSIDMLISDLFTPTSENQIVYRDGRRFTPRLKGYASTVAESNRVDVPSGAFEVRLKQFGTFDKFSAKEFIPDSLANNEVQVEMHYTALNFKETLYVLGFLNPNKRDATDIDFGMEGAGRIKKVGSNVKHLEVGDDVIVWHNGCLRSDFVVNVDKVIKMPSSLSHDEAACIPTVFLTAYYALYHLANIKPGDKILIHACAGGVGQVSLQIAQNVGAEIYATASEGKWEHLRQQGVKHIFNSRTLDFADQIMEATNGEGVDIVFNSLADEFITRSFDVLSENGRFVEIGKQGIWSTAKAKEYRPDVDYQFFEIGEDVVSGGIGGESVIHDLMTQILSDFDRGSLKPLPMTKFDLPDVSSAFRYLSAGKNIGKVVIDVHNNREAPGLESSITDDRTYIVTGGLGALGFLTANWLIKKGARHIVLSGRSKPSKEVAEKISKLTDAGITIEIVLGDVSIEDDVKRIVQHIDDKMKPIGGVMHCAGVLRDGVLTHQTTEDFQTCFGPKVAGGWNLHTATKDRDLQFFVCFSSVSAIFDGGGQSNYAAANAFMDRLVSYRRDLGLPGLSINWGGWADVGMAARLLEKAGAVSDSLLSKEEAFIALERVMIDDRVQAAVCKLGDRLHATALPRLLSDLAKVSDEDVGDSIEIERVFKEFPNNSVVQNMEVFVSRQVLKVLGLDASESIDFEDEFVELGVDSLSMTELKNAVQHGLDQNIKMAILFANSSVSRLAEYLSEQYGDTISNKSSAVTDEAELPDKAIVDFVSLANGASRNVFCYPGLNGNVFDFSEFAKANVGKYNTCVNQFVSSSGEVETDIRKIAEASVVDIKRIQPQGPYSLVGYSYGGVLALETASQLTLSGDKVDSLVMIDTFPHFQYADSNDFRTYMAALIADSILAPMKVSDSKYGVYAKQIMEASMEELIEFFRQADSDMGDNNKLNVDLLRGIVEDGEKRTQAPYQPPASLSDVEIQFFRATQQPRSVQLASLNGFLDSADMSNSSYGWTKYISSPIHVNQLDAHHNTVLSAKLISQITTIIDKSSAVEGPIS